jgi:hypothetical protein
LTVRKSGGDPVHEHANAPDTELGSGAHSPEHDSLPDGIVVAILDLETREALERLFQTDSRPARSQLLLAQDRYGKGRRFQRQRGPQDPDLDPGE